MLRELATVVGIGLLLVTAHVTVQATGGYGHPHALLTISLAIGVGVGSLVIGHAYSNGSRGITFAIVGAMLCCEAFNVYQTCDRLISIRDAAQAPAVQAESEQAKVREVLASAKSELGALMSTRRLDAARETKARADTAVREQASLPGCAVNCRALLEKQVQDANAELSSAQLELRDLRSRVESKVSSSEVALGSIKIPSSGNGLAVRLGVAPWLLDVIVATLGAIGANGLGAGLLAFGAHRPRVVTDLKPTATESTAVEDETPPVTRPVQKPARRSQLDIKSHVEKFGLADFKPCKQESVMLTEVVSAYESWCLRTGKDPLPVKEFVPEIANIARRFGLETEKIGNDVKIVGLTLKSLSDPPSIH